MRLGKRKRPDGVDLRRYSDLKLYPNAEQARLLDENRIARAKLWNALLHQRRAGDVGELMPLKDCFVLPGPAEGETREQRRARLIEEDKAHRSRAREVREAGRHIVWSNPPKDPSKAKPCVYVGSQTKQIAILRRDVSYWKQFGASSLECTVKAMELAFEAFFRRLKAGESPGYPRFKNAKKSKGIQFRDEHVGGWKLDHVEGVDWLLHVVGVTDVKDKSTWIKVRGKLPQQTISKRDMDLIKVNGEWRLSVAVERPVGRCGGEAVISVNLGGLGSEFIRTNHAIQTSAVRQMAALGSEQDEIDAAKSLRDQRYQKFSRRWREMTDRIGKMETRLKRKRSQLLHHLSNRVVSDASALDVVTMKTKDQTSTTKGDAKDHGAAVGLVAEVNRHVLSHAPAAFVQMLEYKAGEAGIVLHKSEDEKPDVLIAHVVSKATKSVRMVRRVLRKVA